MTDTKEEIAKVLSAWKAAAERYDIKFKVLKANYGVELIEADDIASKFKFVATNVEFICPYTEEELYDFELTGDAVKFANGYCKIIAETYNEVEAELIKLGFDNVDTDECSSSYKKDNVTYVVYHWASNVQDVKVLE